LAADISQSGSKIEPPDRRDAKIEAMISLCGAFMGSLTAAWLLGGGGGGCIQTPADEILEGPAILLGASRFTFA